MRSDLADRSLRTAADRPRVLVILDGASEPLRAGEPTSLERAATPALDALCRDGGTLTRVRTVAPWLAPGSESAIPALLGWTPPSAVDRGAVEAAAWEVSVDRDAGERAWRVDVRAGDGSRADAGAVAAAAALLTETRPRHRVTPLAGHRLLVIGSDPLSGDGRVIAPALADTLSDLPRHSLHTWPEGVVPPRLLDERTVVVAARGAAAGIGRLMGARVVVPDGATGRPGSDLAGKARAAVAAIEAGAARVVVHVGCPDEAAHELDSDGKVAAIEAADRDVIGPLAAALATRGGGTLRVCPDHGCDPRDGHHDAEPVPCLEWRTGDTPRDGGSGRLTERAVAGRPVVELAGPLGAGDGAHAQIGASA